MVRIKLGSTLYEFQGSITVNTKKNFLSSIQNPYNPSLTYQYGQYFTDTLEVAIYSGITTYESLFYDILQATSFIIAWETPNGYQSRIIKNQSIPYPSVLRKFSGVVNFTLNSEPYNEINENMPNITRNTIWNVSTIENTNWS